MIGILIGILLKKERQSLKNKKPAKTLFLPAEQHLVFVVYSCSA